MTTRRGLAVSVRTVQSEAGETERKHTNVFRNKFVVRVVYVQVDPLPLAHIVNEVVQRLHCGVVLKQVVGNLLVEPWEATRFRGSSAPTDSASAWCP